MKSLRVAIFVLCASSVAFAGDPEFRAIVKSIEHTYGVHHMRIPFLGVAMLFARPSGVHGLKLAVFEGFHAPDDSEDVRRVVETLSRGRVAPICPRALQRQGQGRDHAYLHQFLRRSHANDDREPGALRGSGSEDGIKRPRHRKVAQRTGRGSRRPPPPPKGQR